MDKIPIRMYNIGKCKQIELLLGSSSVSMHWEEDEPRQESPHAEYNTEDFEESKEEVAIEGGVLENGSIGNLVEISHPFEPALR